MRYLLTFQHYSATAGEKKDESDERLRTSCYSQDLRGHLSRMVFAFGRAVHTLFFVAHFSPKAKNERQKRVFSTRPQAQKTFCLRDRVSPVINRTYAVVYQFALSPSVERSLKAGERSERSSRRVFERLSASLQRFEELRGRRRRRCLNHVTS